MSMLLNILNRNYENLPIKEELKNSAVRLSARGMLGSSIATEENNTIIKNNLRKLVKQTITDAKDNGIALVINCPTIENFLRVKLKENVKLCCYNKEDFLDSILQELMYSYNLEISIKPTFIKRCRSFFPKIIDLLKLMKQ